MVARGSAAGVLHADDITRVLRHIELTPDVLVDVHATLEALGIAVDDGMAELHDDTPDVGVPLTFDFDRDAHSIKKCNDVRSVVVGKMSLRRGGDVERQRPQHLQDRVSAVVLAEIVPQARNATSRHVTA